MKLRPSIALLFALTVSGAGAYAQSAADLTDGNAPRKFSTLPLKPTITQGQAAELSARFLTRFHYDAKPLDDAMSQKIYKAYIDSLDGEKVFFTQADLAKFAPLTDADGRRHLRTGTLAARSRCSTFTSRVRSSA